MIVRLTIIYASILLSLLFSTAAKSAEYDYCNERESPRSGGGLYALSIDERRENKECWLKIKSKATIDSSRLSQETGEFTFAYAFPNPQKRDYDRLFSVTVKELLREDSEDTDPYVELLRDRMETLCSKIGGKQVKTTWSKFERLRGFGVDYPGKRYNRFHRSEGPRGKLADFHVAFLNMSKTCVSSGQQGALRKSFILYDADGKAVEFPDVPEIREIASLIKFFQGSKAFAFPKKTKYKKFKVRIRQGRVTNGGVLMTNFYVKSNRESDVRIQDLSAVPRSGRGIIPPIQFKIRD